jgi:hypothetical protein
LGGDIFSPGSVSGKAVEAGLFEACFAGFADRFAASFVFVVRADVADALLESDAVVVLADCGQFGAQGGRVTDGQQVRLLALRWYLRADLDDAWQRYLPERGPQPDSRASSQSPQQPQHTQNTSEESCLVK